MTVTAFLIFSVLLFSQSHVHTSAQHTKTLTSGMVSVPKARWHKSSCLQGPSGGQQEVRVPGTWPRHTARTHCSSLINKERARSSQVLCVQGGQLPPEPHRSELHQASPRHLLSASPTCRCSNLQMGGLRHGRLTKLYADFLLRRGQCPKPSVVQGSTWIWHLDC